MLILNLIPYRMRAELDEARGDLAWIHNAASWLTYNTKSPRAWQCAQDIADRAATPSPFTAENGEGAD